MEEEKKPKIKVENIYKIFGHHPERAYKLLQEGVSKEEILKQTKQTIAVVDASFTVYEGETLVIMGLSGSGKSTLLRCVNRLIPPTYGKVHVDDTDVMALDDKELLELRRKKFGMVFQRFALFPHRTVRENVEYGLEIQAVDPEIRKEKADDAIELVGLGGWADVYPNQLSGGMQQRVGLARALAVDPDILLMDEAFSALDPLIRTEMQDELLALESRVQKTIVFITHDLDEALKMGDRIVLMKDGKIVQIGTSEDILTNPANDYVAKFLENVDITKVITAEDVMRKPKSVAFLKDGPRTALHKMKEASMSGIFVTKQDREFIGYVSAEKASKAVKEESKDLGALVDNEYLQKVELETPVRDLFKAVFDSKYPVAVIDHENKLRGVIVEGAVLGALAERGEYND